VTQEQDFFGRDLERRQIADNFRAGQPLPVIIEGERRIGKTSLIQVAMRSVAERSQGQLVPLFLPSHLSVRTSQDYAYAILYNLCRYLNCSPRDTGLVGADGRVLDNAPQEFAEKLVALAAGGAPGKRFILCVDELDAILENSKKTGGAGDPERVVALTDALIQTSATPLQLICTMIKTPEEMRTEYGSPFVSRSLVITLGPMPDGEVDELVRGLLLDQVTLDGDARCRLQQLSGGHPYFVKLLLYYLLQRNWMSDPPLRVDASMLEAVLADAVRDREASSALENIYDVHLTDAKRSLLLLLAGRQQEVPEGIEPEDLAMLGSDYVGAAKSLARRGYLSPAETGPYGLRVGLLGHWLRWWERYVVECDRLDLGTLQKQLRSSPAKFAVRRSGRIKSGEQVAIRRGGQP
jgi:hypothetical protein